MKSLIEELKDNFEIKELSPKETIGRGFKILNSELASTHNRAIDDLLKKLEGIKEITLPYLPTSYVLDNRTGGFKATLFYLEMK